jgi:hypothetical protein
MKRCAIDDCGAIHHGRGWCHKHYHRWLRHGDPLYILPQGVKLGFRTPMDGWEKRHVRRLLDQRMSYRAIQRSTGVGYMTVARFARTLRAPV